MKLRSTTQLIKDAWNIYYQNKSFLARVFARSFVLPLPGYLLGLSAVVCIFTALLYQKNTLFLIGTALLVLIALAIGMICSFWLLTVKLVAAWQVVTQKATSVDEVFNLAWQKWRKLMVLNFLELFIFLLGLIFLIIPGIILAAWFSFASIIVVTEDLGPIEAMRKSRKLVNKAFFPVVRKLIITTLSPHTPGFPISSFLIYQDLLNM